MTPGQIATAEQLEAAWGELRELARDGLELRAALEAWRAENARLHAEVNDLRAARCAALAARVGELRASAAILAGAAEAQAPALGPKARELHDRLAVLAGELGGDAPTAEPAPAHPLVAAAVEQLGAEVVSTAPPPAKRGRKGKAAPEPAPPAPLGPDEGTSQPALPPYANVSPLVPDPDPWRLHTKPDAPPGADPTDGALRPECLCGGGIATVTTADGELLCSACAARMNAPLEPPPPPVRKVEPPPAEVSDEAVRLRDELASLCLWLPDHFEGKNGPTTRHETRTKLLGWAGLNPKRLRTALARARELVDAHAGGRDVEREAIATEGSATIVVGNRWNDS